MFKERIIELRKNRKLTQEDVANNLKIAKSTYIKYEKGTQSPQLELIDKIAELYGITASEVISKDSSAPKLNDQLISKLNLITQLEDDEKKSLIMVIEGMVFRNQNMALKKQFS
ncbi:MAG: helix-turn-helix transcriptional regulator [Rhizobiales bacterium]|nr:helix-turn-helix transcriptional regulator [Hyphomicrobiales bacterium]